MRSGDFSTAAERLSVLLEEATTEHGGMDLRFLFLPPSPSRERLVLNLFFLPLRDAFFSVGHSTCFLTVKVVCAVRC